MNKWNIFEKPISLENFIKLDLIKEMIPVIGVRMKFVENLNQFKILNSPVAIAPEVSE